MATWEDIPKYYNWTGTFSKQLEKLPQFATIDILTGEPTLSSCDRCKGPLLGHIRCLSDDKQLHQNEQQILQLTKTVKHGGYFVKNLALIDVRKSACTCDPCNLTFDNRSFAEQHLLSIHNYSRSRGQNSSTHIVTSTPAPSHGTTQMVDKPNHHTMGPLSNFKNTSTYSKNIMMPPVTQTQ